MFEIKVSSLEDAILLRKNWATKTVGLIDPDYKPDVNEKYHVEFFHDIPWPNSKMMTSPTPEHISNVLKFTKTLVETDKILVHCVQGISRSSAMAIGILVQHGFTPKQAVDKIYEVRNIMWPNDLMIKYIDDYFNLADEILFEVSEFKRKCNKRFIIPNETLSEDIEFMRKSINN